MSTFKTKITSYEKFGFKSATCHIQTRWQPLKTEYNKIDVYNKLMTHYLRHDTRIETIKNIIAPFQTQFDNVKELCRKDDFDYWDQIYADDTEHLVGTVFIVLQNYINSSISDLYPELPKLHSKYSSDKKINESTNVTRIELIIALANYYKHRDLPTEIHKYTTNPLENLHIEYKHFYGLTNNEYFHKMGSESPIFEGLSILSENWVFKDLIEIVTEWRENLWNYEIGKIK